MRSSDGAGGSRFHLDVHRLRVRMKCYGMHEGSCGSEEGGRATQIYIIGKREDRVVRASGGSECVRGKGQQG